MSRSLHLDDGQVFDQEVRTIRAFDPHALEHERQRSLCFELQARTREQQTEAGELGVLQQARPELPVNLDGGTDDRRCQLVDRILGERLGHASRTCEFGA